MSLLIADSGSTKTDWALISDASVKQYKTEGLNPHYHSTESFKRVIKEELLPKINCTSITHIMFYGAGCDNHAKNNEIRDIFNLSFPTAKTDIFEDLFGAARACCLDKPGIICILGTGSNSCLYNGNQIIEQIPSLGFILGDEGSAGSFGKELINRYYRDEIPEDLRCQLEYYYDMQLNHIFEGIFEKKQMSRFVASYSAFLGKHSGHTFVNNMLRKGFDKFITQIVLKYRNPHTYDINFVGSLGHAYQHLLKELLSSHQLTPGIFIKSPMKRLIKFHTEYDISTNS